LKICNLYFIVKYYNRDGQMAHFVAEADDDNKNNKNHILSVLFMTYCLVILFQ